MLKRTIGEQIKLEFNHGTDLGYIRVDPVQFSQVIVNLVVNAKDAMNGKGVLKISTRAEKLTEPYQFGADTVAPGEFVVISVTDTGCGIEEKNLSRIFEPFFSTKQNVVGSGTGLGLATVYGIIRQTEGFIKVDSVVGKGTTFSIYLPRFDTKSDEEENAWLGPDLLDCWMRLNEEGYAKSVEVWDGDELVGGLYGFVCGRAFIGDSMFSLVPSASKLAMIHLARHTHAYCSRLLCKAHSRHIVIEALQNFGHTLLLITITAHILFTAQDLSFFRDLRNH